MLYAHQQDGVETMQEHLRWCFWWDTGTGKTCMVLSGLEAIDNPFPALILTKLAIVEDAWIKDAATFTPDLKVVAAIGDKRKRLRALKTRADVVVVNYEGCRASLQEFLTHPWRTVVFDESTALKSHRSKVFAACQRLASLPSVTRAYALSGCPTPNTLLEYWPQVEVVAPGTLETTFWAHRAARFYQPSPGRAHWKWVITQASKADLMADVGKVSSWLRKEDCLDLPETTDEVHRVELARPERLAYEHFVRHLVLQLEEGDVVGATALAEMAKTRQLTAGWARTDTGDWTETGKTKLNYVMDLLDSAGRDPFGEPKPVIIVGQYRKEIERIAEEARAKRRKVGILYGGMTQSGRREAIEGFQQGALDVLVLHPASAGHGLTFVNCDTMIFASLDFSYEQHYQVRQRIHRIGQKRPCTYHVVLAKGTVDELIWRALGKKEAVTIESLGILKGEKV